MKILYFGSSSFSIAPLQALLDAGFDIPAVVTVPPSKKGRGQKLSPNPLDLFAREKGLRVWDPPRLKDAECLQEAKALGIDALVVASYGKFLTSQWLSLPRLAPLNIHPSILPAYRGAAPVPRQILNGEKETGVTVFRMVQEMDAGPIAGIEKMPLNPSENSDSLLAKLSSQGAQLMLRVLAELSAGTCTWQDQDPAQVTFAPKLSKEEGRLDWSHSARQIDCKIRGLYPWPGAFTLFRGKNFKILKASLAGELDEKIRKAGQVIEISKDKGICVVTGSGAIYLESVQLEGKNPVRAIDFANGHRISIGSSTDEPEFF